MAASPLLTKLWCAPGNAGIAQEAECVALDIADHSAVIAFCKANNIDLVMVGPEAPLAAGIVDDLAAAGIKAFGPSKAASQLESSKGFTKDLCKSANIPTAAYERFRDADAAKVYIRKHGAPIVVKADGLAAGKGVVVAMTLAEAEAAIDMMLGGGFGRPAPRLWSKNSSKARKPRSLSSAMAIMRCHLPPLRTTSARLTVIKDRIPAAWELTRPRRS